MAQINGGEMLVRVLEREGVKQIFGLHGGHIDPIFQACADHGIAIYDTRHEAAAGHMAEGWARLTGEPGVVVVTAGPGVTNVVTPVADAFVDAVPMVVIGGRHPDARRRQAPAAGLRRPRAHAADHEVVADGARPGAHRRVHSDGLPRGESRPAGPRLPRDTDRRAHGRGRRGDRHRFLTSPTAAAPARRQRPWNGAVDARGGEEAAHRGRPRRLVRRRGDALRRVRGEDVDARRRERAHPRRRSGRRPSAWAREA